MGLSKRLEKARKAYQNNDLAASSRDHNPTQISKSAKKSHSGSSSAYLGNVIYGGLDGVILLR